LCNNEVAYVAWDIDGKIPGCLGFEVTRVYLNDDGSVKLRPDGTEDRVKCAAWVSFKGQGNPNWIPQDTGVWPVQKMNWRDLTLRKRRDGMTRRPAEVMVRYEIRPVGDMKPGLSAVPSNGREMADIVKRDDKGKPVLDTNGKPVTERKKAYKGTPRPLGYLANPTVTNAIKVTSKRGPFRSTFTNGLLAAQWLRNVLLDDGVIKPNELIDKLEDPDDPHRKYLAGDVLPLIHELFARPGEFFLSLYELEDEELLDILLANAGRIHVILSNTAAQEKVWDARNKAARDKLVAAGVDIQHRMFNNSIHIGHNKFVVHVPPNGGARSVFTGSTNWTSTGVSAQTNNALLIEDDAVAGVFLDYWKRMKNDPLTLPNPIGKEMGNNQQSAIFRQSNANVFSNALANGATVDVWFSPNRAERKKPTSQTKPAPCPPDLTDVYRRMRLAEKAILFLAFYPGQRGNDCIIGEVIEIGQMDPTLLITGAVSSPQAMPNYVPDEKNGKTVVKEGESPATYQSAAGNVNIVRAARIDDKRIIGDLHDGPLTPRSVGAIIHDKVIVIDPMLPTCTVILGSHNLGFKASYSNDENMVVITGDQALAEAYAVHILDVYDHYRFRAVESDLQKKGKKGWSGFLATDDSWQDGYVAGGDPLSRYFAT
jgi:hypothetical protein